MKITCGAFGQVPSPAYLDIRMSPKIRDTLGMLSCHCNRKHDRWAVARQGLIAQELGIKRETVNRHIKQLVEWGYVEKRASYATSGAQLSNYYRVKLDLDIPREYYRVAIDDDDEDDEEAPPPVIIGEGVIAEDHTPVIAEDHTPVIAEDHTPVIAEDHTPVIAEDHSLYRMNRNRNRERNRDMEQSTSSAPKSMDRPHQKPEAGGWPPPEREERSWPPEGSRVLPTKETDSWPELNSPDVAILNRWRQLRSAREILAELDVKPMKGFTSVYNTRALYGAYLRWWDRRVAAAQGERQAVVVATG